VYDRSVQSQTGPRRARAHRLTPWLAVGALAATLAGCGGSSHPPEPDPATVVPASVPFYASANVDPQGTLKTNAVADARRLTGQHNAYASLLGALSLRGPGAQAPREGEVTSWLGERAGLFLERSPLPQTAGPTALLAVVRQALAGELFAAAGTAHGSGANGALVLDTTSPATARGFIHAQSAGFARSSLNVGGYPVTVEDDGEAAAVVGRFLVLGSPSGVRAVIETAQGGPALAHAASFGQVRANAPSNALANVFLASPTPAGPGPGGSESTATNTSETGGGKDTTSGAATASGAHGSTGTGGTGGTGEASNEGSGGTSQPLPPWIEDFAGTPGSTFYLSLVPQPSQIRLDLDTLPPAPDPPSAGESEQSATAQQIFQELPEGSWVAVGMEDLSGDLSKAIALLPALLGEGAAANPHAPAAGRAPKSPTTRQSLALLARSLRSEKGAFGTLSTFLPPVEHLIGALEGHASQFHSIFSGWVGPAGLFVSGGSLLELNAGLVIASTDHARSLAAVSQLGELLKSAHIPVKEVVLPGAEAAISVSLGGLPVPLQIAYGAGKFVVGLGVTPVQAALTPTATLGDSAAYREALSTLGEGLEPRALVSFPQLTAFLKLLGASESATLRQFTPYLHALSTLTIGIGRLAGGMRTSIVLGLA